MPISLSALYFLESYRVDDEAESDNWVSGDLLISIWFHFPVSDGYTQDVSV